MGVSTSASLLIVFFGAFIALGAVYTATSNTSEELGDAYGETVSAQSEIAETALSVDAVYHDTGDTEGNLTVRADNGGSTELRASRTDVLVDGEFRPQSGFDIVTVDGRETNLWKPTEQLRIENESAEPERVKVVAENGVAATALVDVVGLENSTPRTLDRTGNGTDSTVAFDLESTYDENVTLTDVSVDEVDNGGGENPAFIHYAKNESLSEVNVTRAGTGETLATADGNFTLGEQIAHDEFELGPEDEATYRIGEFRDSDGEPVAMPSTTVTVTITYEDPSGVERTFTFTEGDF